MFRLPNVDQKLQGIIQDKIEVSDDFSMAHNLKEENIKKKWENIQKITMKNSQVSNKAIQLLVSHPICKQIQSLELQSNFTAINDNTLQIIAGSNYLLNLKELNLSDDTVTDDGMIYLMASNVSANLESLILYGNFQVSSASLKAIAGSKECKKLEYLDLRSTYVSDIGFKDLAQSKNLQNLKYLNLSMNIEAITDDTLRYLSMSKYINKIQILIISNCSITDDGIRILCNTQNFQNLTELDVSNDNRDFDLNRITDVGVEYLSDTTYITNLEKLNLRGLKITSNGINHLSLSYNFQNLQYLRLSQNLGIIDKAIDLIVIGYAKNLKNLNKLYLNDTRVTEKGIKYLLKSIPSIDVVYDFGFYINEYELDSPRNNSSGQQSFSSALSKQGR